MSSASSWISKFVSASQKKAGDCAETNHPPEDKDMLNIASKTPLRKQENVGELFAAAHVSEARRAKAWLADRIHRSQGEVFSEKIELTPVLAELLLENNPHNRNVRERSVESYKIDIVSGNWSLNGESLKISKDGKLNDGQHRCHAVIRAGRSIPTLITFGVARESRMTVDQGAVRTTGNYLAMDGVKNSNDAAAVAALIWQHENLGRFAAGGNDRPTKSQIAQAYAAHPGIVESIAAIPSEARKVSSKSVMAFCHYLLSRRAGHHAADSFILNLSLGGVEGRNNPINRIRDRLMAEGRKLTTPQKIELILRGWNAHRKGRTLEKSTTLKGELPKVER